MQQPKFMVLIAQSKNCKQRCVRRFSFPISIEFFYLMFLTAQPSEQILQKYNELCGESAVEARRSANAIWNRAKEALADAKKMMEYELRVTKKKFKNVTHTTKKKINKVK